jgi:CxxC motif-containing protein (DUF1111 family)
MNQFHGFPPGHVSHSNADRGNNLFRRLILCGLSAVIATFLVVFVVQGQNFGGQRNFGEQGQNFGGQGQNSGGQVSSSVVDPGPRTGTAGAGSPIAGLTASQLAYFTDGQNRFQEVENVQGGENNGLGPTFNSNQCSSCHSQPAIGGTSPAVNPQVAVANLDGATNTIPSFITLNGPVREARFKFALSPNGGITNTPDGGVHGLFTIQGRSDATGCTLAQPNFEQMVDEHNISFRIPTPVFGAGLMESITEDTILANQAAEAAAGAPFGIAGQTNRSGNDGSITRFGWKAQNKSLLMFAGEAYNVEMGITNELFPNERGYPPTPLPAGCLISPTPEDTTNFDVTNTVQGPSDIVGFANFMRFVDQPAPSCTGTACSASIQDGRNVFINVAKCALCHTPSMTTGSSYVAALSNVQANLFSDLLIHHMGAGLADGVSQGGAGPDQFRTAPLWGIGQRLFFLHDGRASDLMQAIEDHAGQGSEANGVIRIFNGLSETQKRDLLNFLRSL